MKKHDGSDDEIGLPTKAFTPGTRRTAVNEDNVVTKGEQKSFEFSFRHISNTLNPHPK